MTELQNILGFLSILLGVIGLIGGIFWMASAQYRERYKSLGLISAVLVGLGFLLYIVAGYIPQQ